MYKTQKGFTIIELVMVIVILGILAAFAIPRFVNLAGNARVSVLQGLQGSLFSAASMARSSALAQNASDNATGVSISGQTIDLSNGYPTAATIGLLVQSTDGFTSPSSGVWEKTGAPTPANCRVTYAPPASAGGSPTVTTDFTGCGT